MKKSPLYECPDCGGEVSKKADVCPHCGRKMKKKHPVFGAIILIIGILTMLDALGIRMIPILFWARFR